MDADDAPVPNAASLTAMPLSPSRTCTLSGVYIKASSRIEAALWHSSKKFCINAEPHRRSSGAAGRRRRRPRVTTPFFSIHQNSHAAGDVAAVLVIGLARPNRIKPEVPAAERRLL